MKKTPEQFIREHLIKLQTGEYLNEIDENIDPRRMKKYERKAGLDQPVHDAYNLGLSHAKAKKNKNPYPAGKRYDAYEQAHKDWKEGKGHF